MPRFRGPLDWSLVDGPTIASSAAEALIFPVTPIPAQLLHKGGTLHHRASGKLSTTGTPTGIWRYRWGGLAGTLLAFSETLTLGAGSANFNWDIDTIIQARLDGTNGSLLTVARLTLHTAVGTLIHNIFGSSGFDANAPVTVDLSIDKDFAFTFQFGTSDAANIEIGLINYLEKGNF